MEFTRKTYKIWVDKNNYIRIELLGNLTKKDFLQLEKDVLNISQTVQGEKNILFDIGKTQPPDFEGRKLFAKAARMKMWHKIAVFGGDKSSKPLDKLVVAAISLSTVKLFDTKAEALEWLKT